MNSTITSSTLYATEERSAPILTSKINIAINTSLGLLCVIFNSVIVIFYAGNTSFKSLPVASYVTLS